MLRYMLDTNIAVYVLKRKPLQVLDVFNQRHGQMAISSIVYAELVFWCGEKPRSGSKPASRRVLLQSLDGASLHREGRATLREDSGGAGSAPARPSASTICTLPRMPVLKA